MHLAHSDKASAGYPDRNNVNYQRDIMHDTENYLYIDQHLKISKSCSNFVSLKGYINKNRINNYSPKQRDNRYMRVTYTSDKQMTSETNIKKLRSISKNLFKNIIKSHIIQIITHKRAINP